MNHKRIRNLPPPHNPHPQLPSLRASHVRSLASIPNLPESGPTAPLIPFYISNPAGASPSFGNSPSHLNLSARKNISHKSNNITTYLSQDILEQGSTQKRNRGESLETFLRRVSHISIVSRGIESMTQCLTMCKNLSGIY